RAWTGVGVAAGDSGLIVGVGGFGGRGGGGAGGQQPPQPVNFGTPAYEAGLDESDLIATIDGAPATMDLWNALSQKKPGDKVSLGVKRRDGKIETRTMTLKADPTLNATSVDSP